MHELVIVLGDLYVSQEAPDRELAAGLALPGLQQLTRFGTRGAIAGGWRGWLGRWLTGSEAGAPTAAVVAARGLQSSLPGTAWIATPMHLVAGLTSVHVDRRSILRLDATDQAALVTDFQRVFHDSGFHLHALESGDFLLLGPQMPVADTPEPARAMGAVIADPQRAGTGNLLLRRLGGELEMWLHDHAVNDARARRGEPPVTALWMWGGSPVGTAMADADGGALSQQAANAAGAPAQTSLGVDRRSADDSGADPAPVAFGRDAYLEALWTARSARLFPLPQQLAEVFGYSHARRAVLVIEIGLMLHSHPTWTFFDAMAEIDRSFIAPAIASLNRGQCEQLTVLANDQQLTLRARDRFKFWRRTAPGLSGLQ